MPVLVEAFSVIVRADAIKARHDGGWEDFREGVLNQSLTCDNELARVGFMTREDVDRYIAVLERKGLRFLKDGQAKDIAIVDQWAGLLTPCDWLEVGQMGGEAGSVAACRLIGSVETQLFTPEGWRYEGSASQTLRYVSKGEMDETLEYLGRQDHLDVYRERATGKLLYVGRADR
ncbi:hypothetical protein [Reyranella soli]|jgi:hypothetical protein|uniref:Uncharacterized protein n=1 Tax=Reyranella soli TaxID=1230389 RepID=A0A512NRQ3_9HYPH|nr:hypothetical protein [Reyranella soli]GEP61619.1 hypothetical protein RSO01_87850 [Reyranella soli]